MATLNLKSIAELSELYCRCWELIESRGAAYSDDPLGMTGLYTRALKIGGTREYPVLVEDYSLDRRLVHTMLKTLKYIAIERRQWKRSDDKEGQQMLEKMNRDLAAGRERVAKMRAQREAVAAAAAAAMNEKETASEMADDRQPVDGNYPPEEIG